MHFVIHFSKCSSSKYISVEGDGLRIFVGIGCVLV